MLNIRYAKKNNDLLFRDLSNTLLVSNITKFNPIYRKFFNMNSTNYNSIALNHLWHIHSIEKKEQEDNDSELMNVQECKVENITTKKRKSKSVFFKMAPIVNPYKYLIGKCNSSAQVVSELPSLNVAEKLDSCDEEMDYILKKKNSIYNASYVDGFFNYLSDYLLQNHNMVHGLAFYGSFIGIKEKYKLNVYDDIDVLFDSEFFLKNHSKLFHIDNFDDIASSLLEDEPKRKPIQINHSVSLELDVEDITTEGIVQSDLIVVDLNEMKELTMDIQNIVPDSKDFDLNDDMSSCSSKTSYTLSEGNRNSKSSPSNHSNTDTKSVSDSNSESDSNSVSDSNSDTCSYDSDEEEEIIVTIPSFPVNVVCMEYCEDTFDNLIHDNQLTPDEWYSALFQIIMTLVVYQKAFHFTHNDLHTNNIMFNHTDKKYLFYKYNGLIYKVPTFGRIFKIIDFGRGIYSVNGRLFCSDSFEPDGDADTQYNTEPYFDPKKPRIDPNYSFDLCRLACSCFDYLVTDIKEVNSFINSQNVNTLHYVKRIITEWCLDDDKMNVLYKSNGEDRYPGFKLYKMIARRVHHHIPHEQLSLPPFKRYVCNGSSKSGDVIDIDAIPVLA